MHTTSTGNNQLGSSCQFSTFDFHSRRGTGGYLTSEDGSDYETASEEGGFAAGASPSTPEKARPGSPSPRRPLRSRSSNSLECALRHYPRKCTVHRWSSFMIGVAVCRCSFTECACRQLSPNNECSIMDTAH